MAYDTPQKSESAAQPDYDGLAFERYKAFWQEWIDNYREARRQSFRDQEYYDGDVKGTGWGQWTTDELAKLAARKQPPTVFNIIYRKINAIAGVEQRSRAEPRAYPRTPKDQKSAEIATDCLRFVKTQTNLPMTSANGFLDALIAGYTASEITGERDSVGETLIEWRDFAFDPFSRAFDFSDARWLAVAKWIDADVARETYVPPEPEQPQIPPQPMDGDPTAAMQWAQSAQAAIKQYESELAKRQQVIDSIDETITNAKNSDALSMGDSDYEDHPNWSNFGDKARKRIFVIDMWHRDPKMGWFRCVFTSAGKLFTQPATLIEQDRWGKKVKTHPIKAFALHVSKNGWRYGEVRGMRSAQDEVNKRRSKALHLLTMNRVRGTAQAIQTAGGKESVRTEVARPDSVIQTEDPQNFIVDTNMALAQGQQQLGEEAVSFLEQAGPNPQLQGIQGQASSGRAVLALQQAGLGALGPIFDRFHDWEDRRYDAMWARIQQYWDGPMYVRVTDDKNAARFAAVNGAPVVNDNNGNGPTPNDPRMGVGGNGGPPIDPDEFGPAPQGGLGGRGLMMGGAQGQQMPPGMPGQPQQDPEQFGPMLAELNMDIIIDRAPEAATLQSEQFDALVKLAQGGVLGPPGNPDVSRMLVTASSLPQKSEILDLLDKMQSQQQPSPADMAKLKQLEAMIAKLMAETDKTKAETDKTRAEIPGVAADNDKTDAEATSARVEATVSAVGASRALGANVLQLLPAAQPPQPPAPPMPSPGYTFGPDATQPAPAPAQAAQAQMPAPPMQTAPIG